MLIKEVTDQIEWPPHWGKALGVGGDRSSHPSLPHVTEIVDLILEDMGVKKPEGWPQESLQMAAEMGFSWEWVIEQGFVQRFGEVIERVGEVGRDGIVGSPDGYHPETNTLHEYKCKWSSSDKFRLEEQEKWLMQVKSYCKILGCRRVRFWVFFIVGNYKYGPEKKFPHPRIFDLEFTQEEVDEHWEVMKRYRKVFIEKNKEKSGE